MSKVNCLICERIDQIKKGENPFFVTELETGYVVIGDYQFFRGYTLFLCKQHVSELHELNTELRQKYLNEMSVVAEAVFRAFKPKKLNYVLLGNLDPHLHWHIVPRYEDDPEPQKPAWSVDKSLRKAEGVKPSEEDLDELKKKLLVELG